MDNFAHVALWRFKNGHVGVAVVPPLARFAEFLNSITGIAGLVGQVYPEDFIFFFPSELISETLSRLGQVFGATCCPTCIKMQAPCSRWLNKLTFEFKEKYGESALQPLNEEARSETLTQLSRYSIAVRDTIESRAILLPAEETRRLRRVRQEPDPRVMDLEAASRLTERQAREVETLPTVRQVSRSLPETTRQAPTPAGTIRCTHCGQVIPPGFDKAKDTKKTEDEIYAECKHEFNPTTKICSKCRMEERTEGSRFSFLEVD